MIKRRDWACLVLQMLSEQRNSTIIHNEESKYVHTRAGYTHRTSKAFISIISYTQRVFRIENDTPQNGISRRLASTTPRYGY